MKSTIDVGPPRPLARADGLVVEALDSETLVYDTKSHRAHCLNSAAALVWRLSDGKTSVPEMVGELSNAGLPADESIVWMALDQLHRACLLEGNVVFPEAKTAYSRRQMLRVLGLAAGMMLLLPAVDSVVAPLAAQAASCVTGQACRQLQPPNCGGLPICNRRNRCCLEVGGRRRRRCRPRTC
jgi:hypothetical protein